MTWAGWRWLLLLLLCLPFQHGQGQPVSGIRYGVEQGLPSSRVYAVRQDARGLIWMATDKGVVRFDGNSFRVYSESDGLENTDVWGLLPDRHGRMWLLSYSPYLHFLEGDSLHRIPSPLPTEAFPLYGLIDDGPDITVNLGGHPGMQYTMTLGATDTVTPEVRLHHAAPLLLGIDAFGHRIRYTAGDTVHLHVQDTAANHTERIPVPLQPGELMTQLVLMADFTRVVLRTDQALYQLNYRTHQLVRQPFDALLPGRDTLLDVPRTQVTDSLVFLWYHGAMQALNLALKPTALLPETTGNIQSAFRDREGNFWLGTDGQGVQFIPAQRLLVDHLPLTADRQPTEVTAMAALDEYRLLVSLGNGALQVISEKGRQTSPPAQWLSGTGLRWREPLRLIPAAEHQLWLLTDEYVLRAAHTDGPIEAWRWHKVRAVLGQEMYFKDAAPDGSGGCWLATSRGTFHLAQDGALTEQCALRTNALARSANGTLWMGTSNGILRHANGTTDYPGGSLPRITSSTKLLAVENDSAVWVHYSGKGIGLLEGQQWYPVPGTEHLQVHALTRHDALYVAHHQGIARISRAAHLRDSFVLEALPVHGALLTPEVRHLVVSDSLVMVGTAMGLSVIRQPNQPVFVPPLVRLTSVQWGNQLLNPADEARLIRSEKRLRIGFQGLSYQSLGAVRYRYRLLPDSSWVNTTDRSVQLANLHPGAYRLEVEAINAVNQHSTTAAAYAFVIQPHWTRSWWFLGALLASGMALVLGGYRWRIRNLRQRYEHQLRWQERVADLETKALSARMNPHFIFNALNSLQSLVLDEQNEQAFHYIGQFGKLIRLNLELSAHRLISLHQELERLRLYVALEHLRLGDNLTFNDHVAPALNAHTLQVPNMVLQPLVENAIVHGFQREASIENTIDLAIVRHGEGMRITIRDNGIGLAESGSRNGHRKESQGLALVKERLQRYGQGQAAGASLALRELTDAQGRACGTEAIIFLPMA